MVVFPNGKINLGLQILRRRADGYHDLQTVFYPVPLCDALEVAQGAGPGNVLGIAPVGGSANPAVGQQAVSAPDAAVQLTLTGIPVQGNTNDNLCVKAYHLLKKDFAQLPSIAVHLHKNIPAGAGLGGGSADGAFMLRLLNDKFRLGISQEALIGYALQLGSDCPFFILNTACLAEGRGERLQPVDLDLSDYSFLLVNPGLHISTAWAFSQVSSGERAVSLAEVIRQPVSRWRELLVNDFEAPVCRQYPELQAIREKLYAAGAVYVSMSGSGSTFYGLFPKGRVSGLDWPEGYVAFVVE